MNKAVSNIQPDTKRLVNHPLHYSVVFSSLLHAEEMDCVTRELMHSSLQDQ